MHKIAISVGDLNGVGLELILRSHDEVSKLCDPIYCVSKEILEQAKELCHIEGKFRLSEVEGNLKIEPAKSLK